MILDSNIVITLVQAPQSPLVEWVFSHRPGRLYINPIIFAEVAPNFQECAQLEGFLAKLEIAVEPLTMEECHRAGHAFRRYRELGGKRSTILPDFLIGAQAAIRGWPLVTCDRKGFASYFPDLRIIDPMEPSP